MREIRNTCLEYGCVKCCLDTEMLLSSSDIVRIRGLGFSEDFFIVKKKRRRDDSDHVDLVQRKIRGRKGVWSCRIA